MSEPVLLALLALGALVFGWELAGFLLNPSKRKRAKQRIKCFFGSHAPGPVTAIKGGRERVSWCMYCEKVTSLYEVTPNKSGIPTIRRIH
jgi:hypothetical protein